MTRLSCSFCHFKLTKMRWISVILIFLSVNGYSQWKDYKLSPRGDTLNRTDMASRKQGPWVNHFDQIRGEPGYEEEGWYKNDRKEGDWRIYSLQGDMIGLEHYKWGFKDGVCQYFTIHGQLRTEQSWLALNPDKAYDTIEVEDPNKLDSYSKVVVKNEGASLKNGTWKYYDPETGSVIKTESYTLGKENVDSSNTANANPTEKKAVPKPKEVLDFEKKASGKKKVKYRDGSTGG